MDSKSNHWSFRILTLPMLEITPVPYELEKGRGAILMGSNVNGAILQRHCDFQPPNEIVLSFIRCHNPILHTCNRVG